MMSVVSKAKAAVERKHYLEAEYLYEQCGRLLGSDLFVANQKIVKNRILSRFARDVRGCAIDPQIYYCIPVMNRLEDLKATLFHNLTAASNFSKVHLIINLFDKTSESFDWIMKNCAQWIDAGFLTVNRLEPLPFWHFSWAKNSFKEFIGDDGVYSSLDGDNYITIEEIARTKQIFAEYGLAVVHHFSGVWGDGSSGRVSVASNHYKMHGYEEALFPRQFDEISLLLKILNANEEVKFFCRDEGDIFVKSSYLRTFQELNKWSPKKRYIEFGKTRAPENPKEQGYAQRDEVLQFFTSVNAFFSLLLLSKTKESISFFEKKLIEEKKKIVQSVGYERIAEKAVTIFKGQVEPERSGVPTLYSVVKNDEFFLGIWLAHYRALGVKRFIIVDDRSDRPIVDLNLGDDVFIFEPVIGDFKNFKVFWLQCLMRRFQTPGTLCVCADSDEFLDIPGSEFLVSSDRKGSALEFLQKTNSSLAKYGRIPGMLIDLMPEDQTIQVTTQNFINTMDHHVCVRAKDDAHSRYYSNYPSIKWAFGRSWSRSYRCDLRYHVYGTFDCLRKFPVLIYSIDLELNQGFHDLKRGGDGEKPLAEEKLLPIRHYKMLKVLAECGRQELKGYFGRTAENLHRIYSSGHSELMEKWKGLGKRAYSASYVNSA